MLEEEVHRSYYYTKLNSQEAHEAAKKLVDILITEVLPELEITSGEKHEYWLSSEDSGAPSLYDLWCKCYILPSLGKEYGLKCEEWKGGEVKIVWTGE